MKTWPCVLLLVVSIACKKKKQEQQPPPPPAADAATMTPDAPSIDVDAAVAAVATPPAGAIAITEAGVGPVNEKSAIDVKALETAFPGFTVKKAKIDHGGDLADEHVAVTKDGKLAMKIYGDSMPNSIEVVSDEIWNPWGLKIGMTHAEVAKVTGPFTCSDGAEHTDWKNYVIECSTEKTKNWSFDFQHGGTPASEVIDDATKLAGAKLVAIRWEAPGSGPPGTE